MTDFSGRRLPLETLSSRVDHKSHSSSFPAEPRFGVGDARAAMLSSQNEPDRQLGRRVQDAVDATAQRYGTYESTNTPTPHR